MGNLPFAGEAVALSPEGLSTACHTLGVEAAVLWAVLQVETSGVGFLPDRRPGILFERHIFSRRTGGRFDAGHPGVSQPQAGGYGPEGAAQYDRLAEALALDRRAALESASWGLGQVMGFNAGVAGYAGVEELVAAMMQGEDAHVAAMTAFIRKNGLARALAGRDWASFARGYNGVDYARNAYDRKLAEAYGKLTRNGLPDLTVRAVQLYLTYLDYDPKGVDGFVGRNTRSAVAAFLADAGLPGDTAMAGVLKSLCDRLG
ncbi:MAG: DUF3380 domain-containing protein [Magnetococcales bacterium]|nr:DUF3380 domain-containing protein [Magnetococcales bacterium]